MSTDLKMSYKFNHGLSQNNDLYELIRGHCKIIKAGLRFYPMCVQFLKLMVNEKIRLDELTFGLDISDKSIFISNEFANDLITVLDVVSKSRKDLYKEYLGLFPMVINDSGRFLISIDLLSDDENNEHCAIESKILLNSNSTPLISNQHPAGLHNNLILDGNSQEKNKKGIIISIQSLGINKETKTLIFNA